MVKVPYSDGLLGLVSLLASKAIHSREKHEVKPCTSRFSKLSPPLSLVSLTRGRGGGGGGGAMTVTDSGAAASE